MTMSEVINVDGYIGNFKVRIKRRARYVNEKECTACGECAKVCPETAPDEFNLGLSTRKAIYQPFPQAVPSSYLIKMDECRGFIACGKCYQACEKRCINFFAKDSFVDIEVGTIIVATGMEPFDASVLEEYGYTRYENVITSMEFERLINAGGPTGGHLVRLSDKKTPKSVAFIQCIGSRSKRGMSKPYCSNICCMNTVKDTLLIHSHYPDVEMKVFYMDIRAFGKGFEDLYDRSRKAGVRYIHSMPGYIEEDPETKSLIIHAEDCDNGGVKKYYADMVVLSVGLVPRKENDVVKRLLSLSYTKDGFFMEAHPKLQPVDAPTGGVFFAGCAEGPKDVKDSVTQASAAASRAMRLMATGRVKVGAVKPKIDLELCRRCGRCAGVCPYGAIKWTKGEPPIIIEALCAGCGGCAAECPFGALDIRHFTDAQILEQIEAALLENPQEKVLAFACNWCSYAGADNCGVSRFQYPPSVRLIKTMCSARVSPNFVYYAFRLGAPIVLVSGCHLADCHYINANRNTFRRVQAMWDRLEKWGIRPQRLQLEWISAAEGERFAKVMEAMEALRKTVTKEEIEQAQKATADYVDKFLKQIGRLDKVSVAGEE